MQDDVSIGLRSRKGLAGFPPTCASLRGPVHFFPVQPRSFHSSTDSGCGAVSKCLPLNVQLILESLE